MVHNPPFYPPREARMVHIFLFSTPWEAYIHPGRYPGGSIYTLVGTLVGLYHPVYASQVPLVGGSLPYIACTDTLLVMYGPVTHRSG